MSRRLSMRRPGAATLTIATVTALIGATPASAQPETAPATPSVVARHLVTLITSDVVELRMLSDGDAVATVLPATGRQGTGYATRKVDDQLYVVPTDAMPLLAAGKLDEELFSVTALVANGYDDARSPTLPLIVQYEAGQANVTAMAAPPGSTSQFTLESINARSVREHKGEASSFWAALAGSEPGLTGAAGAVRKVWLNRKVTAALIESVPQVRAPQAWAAGYDGTGETVAVVDTGIDATHPDLDEGKVVAAANFSNDADTIDNHGHGTHVASTAAGTGEAAPAARKGVAPGAKLLNAKVLNRSGGGTFDAVIEGLEWAADQGAGVANVSIGTLTPAAGSDPVTEAVDAISRSSGMLIVIAAGNLGSGESTITTPGWADEALTVGNVDKQDALYSGSSRGPRRGDFAIKPDITAPGTNIVAARAQGTTIGPIVDKTYQTLTGTSMATPHVAGAAAILAQRFPDYTNRQLKDALISTAKTNAGQTVYQQGGGRLDVARALSQQVYASPGTLNLGYLTWPQTDQAVSQTVSYANDTAADVTLDLSLNLSGKNSDAPPEGMFTLSQPQVTVPAGGTASVMITLNPLSGPLDLYGGYLVGTSGGGTIVHTSVGAFIEPEMYNVTVSGIARDGRPAAVISSPELWSPRTGLLKAFYSQNTSTATFRVPPGTYSLAGYLGTADAANAFAVEMSVVTEPQLEVTGDRNITLDARTANPIVINTPRPTAPYNITLSYHRGLGDRSLHSSFMLGDILRRVYASPTAAVTKGDFEFYSKAELIAPPLQAAVTRPSQIPLEPKLLFNSPAIDGKHDLPVTYVGSGRPDDYVGRDVHGRVVLVQRTPGMTFNSQIVNAANAGAWAVLIFNDRPGLLVAFAGDPGKVPIPAFSIDQDPGRMLLDLLGHGPVTVRVSGTSVSPFAYDLLLPEKQRVPTSLTYNINRNNTAEIGTRYTADVAGGLGTDVRHVKRPWPTFSVAGTRPVPRPLHRTYYVSANDTLWQHQAWSNSPFDGAFDSARTRYTPRGQLSENWFGRVSRPGASALWGSTVSRTGDELTMAVFPFSDSDGHFGWGANGDVYSTKLYAGTQLLKETNTFPFGTFPATADPATYRLVLNAKRANAWSRYSTETNTTWTFTSRRPATGKQELPPLLQADFALALDDYNQAPDRRSYRFTVDVGYLPGAKGPGRTSVGVWASSNDGATWKKLDLRDLGNGKRQATVTHPKAENTSGAVSLRISATDAAGNSLDQTVYRAYGLKPAN